MPYVTQKEKFTLLQYVWEEREWEHFLHICDEAVEYAQTVLSVREVMDIWEKRIDQRLLELQQ